MKRIDGLYDRIISVENLMVADENARRGKTHTYGVIKHDRSRESNIRALHESLRDGTYVTSPYRIFTLFDRKERTVYQLPYYPDRIVHHAVMNVMEPIWVSCFVSKTYSCIRGRGVHDAVRDIKRDLRLHRDETAYCLKMDVRKFYPSIDNSIMKHVLRRKIKDARLLALLDEIVDSAPGVPIGNYLSQYFANLYLTYFDHWMKEVVGCRFYYRYADDIVVLGSSKEFLQDVLRRVKRYLSEELQLELNGSHQVFPIAKRGIDFIGYRFYHTHTLLRKRIKQSLFRKVARLNRTGLTRAEYKREVCSYKGWASHCDSVNLLRSVWLVVNDESIRNTSKDKSKMNAIP